MTVFALALLFLACVAVLAFGYFVLSGKYNTLVTLRKHALQSWIDLATADLRLAHELRNKGFASEADMLEEAAHYAVAVFGHSSALQKLSAARACALVCGPSFQDHLTLVSIYKEKASFYNLALRDSGSGLLAKCFGLLRLPN